MGNFNDPWAKFKKSSNWMLLTKLWKEWPISVPWEVLALFGSKNLCIHFSFSLFFMYFNSIIEYIYIYIYITHFYIWWYLVSYFEYIILGINSSYIVWHCFLSFSFFFFLFSFKLLFSLTHTHINQVGPFAFSQNSRIATVFIFYENKDAEFVFSFFVFKSNF